jgi:hypothetical protein
MQDTHTREAAIRLPGLLLTPDRVSYSETSQHIRFWREGVAEGLIVLTEEESDFQRARLTYLLDQEAYLRQLARAHPEEPFAAFVRERQYVEAAKALQGITVADLHRPDASEVQAVQDAAEPTQDTLAVAPHTLKFSTEPVVTETSWADQVRELTLGILRGSREQLKPGNKFPIATAQAVLLLCLKKCGVEFMDPRMESISLAYFQQAVKEKLIPEPAWLRPGVSKSRSILKGWNDFFKPHQDQGRCVRAKYIPLNQSRSVSVFGLTTTGEAYFHGIVVKAGVRYDLLTQSLQKSQQQIHLPAAFASELRQNPDFVRVDEDLVA